MTTQLKFYVKYLLIGLFVGIVIGFFIGRATTAKEEIKIVKGETIKGSASNTQFEPIKEEKPEQSALPLKKNTPKMEVDTAAIISEYETKRSYAILAFDNNKYGKLQLYPTLQYNRLVGLDYNFTPMIEQRKSVKSVVWQPFVSASYSTLNYVGLGGGVFYHNLGFEYQYQRGFRNTANGHSFGLKYRF